MSLSLTSTTFAGNTMISATTTTGTAARSSSTSCVLNYEIPVQDAACAAVHSDISDKIMKQCCNGADIVSINDGCAAYCLAQGQDVGALSKCLYSNGFTGNSVYCNKPQTATATATAKGTTTGTNSGSSATATGSVASTTGTASGTGTGTATGTGASPSSTTGAAVPNVKLSTGSVGVLALLFCSALFGVVA